MSQIKLTILLLRYGEISLKSDKVRRRFEKQLENNIKFVLDKEKVPYNIERLPLQGRIFVETEFIEKASKILSNVFGIVSISPVKKVSSKLSVILEEVLNFAKVLIKRNNTFAIRVRRTGKHEYSSQDVAIQGGALINNELKDRNIKVDLTNPDVTIYIEVRDNRAYLFKDIIKGLGGFPYNSQDNLVSLFFGDIPSFLSTWLMLRKGCHVIPIFFNFSIFLPKDITKQVIKMAQELKRYVNSDDFFIYEIQDCQKLIESAKSLENLDQLQINLQIMFLIAEKIANLEKARGIVTYHTFSDIVNLQNIYIIEKITTYPIFRPLLGLDKNGTSKLMVKFKNISFIDNKELFLKYNKHKGINFQSITQPKIKSIRNIVKYAVKNAKKLYL